MAGSELPAVQGGGKPPHSITQFKRLGLNYALGGLRAESEKAFRRAVELDPLDAEAHYLLGRALYDRDALREAESELELAGRLNPRAAKPHVAMGQVCEKRGDFPGAERCYRKALSLCSAPGQDCSWPFFQMGFLSLRLGHIDDAEPYLRQAAAARPDWSKPRFYLGRLLMIRGDLNGAKAQMQAAVRLDGSRAEYHYQLAMLLRRMSEASEAEAHMARFLLLRRSQ